MQKVALVSEDWVYISALNLRPSRQPTYHKNNDGVLNLHPTTGELTQERHYYPFGLIMEGLPTYSTQSGADRHRYNGIEQLEDIPIQLNNAFFRTHDPAIGRWWGVDPKAEYQFGLSPYNSMNNNPISYADPEGDVAFVPILIGMAIGAAVHTGVHLATHNFTFNNWNWGSFAGSVVAGGVGGVVGPALEAAHIGGFYGGAILGASTGFSHNLTSGLINRNLSAGGLAKSTLLGAEIGGLAGGIEAELRGYRFLDGKSKILQERSLLATENTPKTDNPYYDKYKQYEINEVNDLSVKAPKSHTVDVNKGFEGELSVSGTTFGQESGSTFFVEADRKVYFESKGYEKFSVKIPSKSKTISWGFKGGNLKSAQLNQLGNTPLGVRISPNPFIKIQGQWRGWDGFLFWGH